MIRAGASRSMWSSILTSFAADFADEADNADKNENDNADDNGNDDADENDNAGRSGYERF